MTQDEIIQMAFDAGFDWSGKELTWEDVICTEELMAFAKLIAAKEREACAKVCETHGVHPALNVWNGGPDWYKHGKNCAAAIRARGEA
jgi:hypothetical protein